MDEAWRALAHATRRDILRLVRDRERTAGDIAAAFAMTRPAVSQHLTLLKDAGLLAERREGTKRLYRLRPAGLRRLREDLRARAPGSDGPTVAGWQADEPLETLASGWRVGADD